MDFVTKKETFSKQVYVSPKLRIRQIDFRDIIMTSNETGVHDQGQDGSDFDELFKDLYN